MNENYIRLNQDDKNTFSTRVSPTRPSPKLAPTVAIKNTNYLGFQCIYWLRTSDGGLIKPNLARPDDYDKKMIADISQTLQQNEKLRMNTSSSDMIPINALQSKTH